MYLGIQALLGLQVFPEIPMCLQGEMIVSTISTIERGFG